MAMAMALKMALGLGCSSGSFSSAFGFLRLGIEKKKRTACNRLFVSRSTFSIRAAQLSREEKEKLLAGVSKDHLESTTKVLEQAVRASGQWNVIHTDFLTPTAKDDALSVLSRLADVGYVISGGYSQAERCRLSMGSKEAIDASLPQGDEMGVGFPGAVSAINVQGKFSYDQVSHGDFLGAVLGTGIVREKVGDILVQEEDGAFVFVVPELVEYLKTSLTKVRNTPVVVDDIPLSEIRTQPQKVQVIRSVEASLRIDALASAGFRISRTKFSDLISKGDVRVNWKEVTKSGLTLKQGDMVSVKGKGRLQIGEISTTKKGRYAVELTRYL